MRYVSTRGSAPILGFDDVVLTGLGTDGGLYVPEEWPSFDVAGVPPGSGYAAVATEYLRAFVGGSAVEHQLDDLVASTYRAFRHPDVAPLTEISPDRFLLELFWGPTLSFKDYALQLVGGLFDRILEVRGESITVLGATSGDTGSAAIEACRDRGSVDIAILYPDGRVSEVQRRQMTTVLSENVRAVAVDGTFDDCQDLVKSTFADGDTRRRFRLAAVNSINWARIVAQAAYYAYLGVRLGRPFSVAVPTGNFGNVFAAYVARRTGVPISRLVVGNNANHGLADLIDTGRLPRGPVVPTIAPAMDIQIPSNLERLLFELFERDGAATAAAVAEFRTGGVLTLDERRHDRVRATFEASWADDATLARVMAEVHHEHGLVIDPHTAAGWHAADHHSGADPMVVIATAHPVKFSEAVIAATGVEPLLPDDLADLLGRAERITRIPATAEAVAGVLEDFGA
ncbi:MAG TPA: threonine synthase [Acidimicrobiia bacterium]